MAKKIRLGYDILSKRAIETESGVNIDDALRRKDTEIADINVSITNLDTTVSGLQTGLAEASEDIEDIKSDITDIGEEIVDINDEIDTVSGIVITNTSHIAEITEDLNDLDGKIDDIEAVIPSDATSDNKLVSESRLAQAIADFGGFEIVDLDPDTQKPDVDDPSEKIIYLTKDSGSTATDPYTEWIYKNGWEIIGETTVDLSNYYNKTETDGLLDDKVDKESGKGLSSNDFTNAYKTKLDEIETSAQRNVQSDWEELDINSDAFIKNKPQSLSLVGGEGISVEESQGQLEISVSANYATETYVDQGLETKLDKTTSAEFYPYHSNPSGYLTEHQSLEGYATEYWVEQQNYLTTSDLEGYATENYVQQETSGKVDKENGKGLSTNDYTNDDKAVLGSVSARVEDIEELIPANASTLNQLATLDDIGTAATGAFKVVPLANDEPDVSNPSTKIIYLTRDSSLQVTDPYTEWIWESGANSAWHIIGETTPDLSDYYTKTEVNNTFATSAWVETQLDGKVDKVTGMGLSHEDFTSAYKDKIDTIEASAQKNVQSDWSESNSASDSYINHKPEEADVIAGPGISIEETAQGFVFSVSGDYAETSAVTQALSAKMDKSSSADFYPMGTNPSGYLTSTDLNGYATEQWVNEKTSSFITSDALRAYATNEYLDDSLAETSAWAEATFASASQLSDYYPNSNPSGFLVQSDLSDYATEDYVYSQVSGKVDKVSGYGLSQEDFTSAYKDKLDSISPSAEHNVQSDWEEVDSGSDSYIKNKPAPLSLHAGENISITESGSSLIIAASGATQINADWNATSGVAEILNKPDLSLYAESASLADVAFTGDYEDLTNTPTEKAFSAGPNITITSADDTITIGATVPEQVQSDWGESDSAEPSYIKNKPQNLSIVGGEGITITESQGNLEISVSADYATESYVQTQTSVKADKVSNATQGHLAALGSDGNLLDSTYSPASFATSAQGAKADTAVQDANYVHTDNNYTTTEKNLLSSLDTSVSAIEEKIPTNATAQNKLVTKSDLDAAATGAFEVVPLGTNDQPDVAYPNGKTIYLTKDSSLQVTDPYTEWIWLSGTSSFEVIGETSIDLTDYATQNYVLSQTSGKVDKVTGMGLSHVDFTSAYQNKLDSISPSAEVNVQSDWSVTNSALDSYIANKPDILIPQIGTGVSAMPSYIMVVTAMPPAAQIDPNTIYLVQGTYIGT